MSQTTETAILAAGCFWYQGYLQLFPKGRNQFKP